MSIITSPELFKNVKRKPDKYSKEYEPFYAEETKKIQEGVTINSVLIPGWLYWHVNHWKIDIDYLDPTTQILFRKTRTPDLRDNEWLIGEAIHRAEVERKGLLILGSRQLGKSEFGSSYTGRRAIAFPNTQNIVAGLSSDDLQLLTSKIDRGFVNMTEYYRPITMLDNWKSQVHLGYKDKTSGKRHKYSEILIRNLEEGKSSGSLAGPTTSSLLLDEVGKGPFLSSFIAARQALLTPYGWRCSPIFTGTSGSFEKSDDLMKFYHELDAYNFLCVTMLDIYGKQINFIPGYQASESKRHKISLSEHLNVPQGTELDLVKIHVVTNIHEEIANIKLARKKLRDAGELVLEKQETMYRPLDEKELFLKDDSGSYFTDVKGYAKEHLAYLDEIYKTPGIEEYGFFVPNSTPGGKPKFVTEEYKRPIIKFPADPKEDKDCPVTIWAHPLPGQQFGVLHVGGSDPYNQDYSFYSSSLGAVYIYRRMYDAINGKFQNRFVAAYVARPENQSKWYEQVKMLLEYYDATLFTENENKEIISYFDNRHLAHWLEDGLQLAKELNPHTVSQRVKGLSAAPANIKHGNSLLKSYCMEDIIVNYDSKGNPIYRKGITLIPCRGLLAEIIGHSDRADNPADKKRVNVDRIVGARHALIIANSKDKLYPTNPIITPPVSDKKPQKIVPGPFIHSRGSFKKSRSPFRSR